MSHSQVHISSTNHSLIGQQPQDNFAIAEEEDKEQEANEMSAEKLKETEDDQEWKIKSWMNKNYPTVSMDRKVQKECQRNQC